MKWKSLTKISRDEKEEFEDLWRMYIDWKVGKTLNVGRLRLKIESVLMVMDMPKKRRFTDYLIARGYLTEEFAARMAIYNGVIWSLTYDK